MSENLAEEFRRLALRANEEREALFGMVSVPDSLIEVYERQIQRYSALATMEYARLSWVYRRKGSE